MEKQSSLKNFFVHLSIAFAPVVTLLLFLRFFEITRTAMGELVVKRWIAPFNSLGIPISVNVGYIVFFICLIGAPLLGATACWLRLRKRQLEKRVKIQLLIVLSIDVLLLGIALYDVLRVLITT